MAQLRNLKKYSCQLALAWTGECLFWGDFAINIWLRIRGWEQWLFSPPVGDDDSCRLGCDTVGPELPEARKSPVKATTQRIHREGCTHVPPGGSSCRTPGRGYWMLCSCISHCLSSGLSVGRGNGRHHLHKSQWRLLVSSQGCLPGTRPLQALVSLKL